MTIAWVDGVWYRARPVVWYRRRSPARVRVGAGVIHVRPGRV